MRHSLDTCHSIALDVRYVLREILNYLEKALHLDVGSQKACLRCDFPPRFDTFR